MEDNKRTNELDHFDGTPADNDLIIIFDVSADGGNGKTFNKRWDELPSGGGGDVASVNGQTGTVVLDADDIDDTSTTNKFATASQLANADSAVQPGDLATVATTGDYDDLIGKPTLGTAAADDSTDFATAAQGAKADTALQSVIGGTNVTVDDTDPLNPVISASGGGGGGAVDSVNAQTGVVVLDQDDIGDGSTYKQYSQTEKTKLSGIESGAEVNNISDTDATDLTDGGSTTLHNHDGRYYTETEVDNLIDDKPTLQDVDITVTVGSGGDYPNINAAIEALSILYPTYKNNGLLVEISLLSGFVMAEQVLVRRLDLSWIVITSVDATVTIDYTAITVKLVPNDEVQPAFGAAYNAKLPIIGAQFAYASKTTSLDGVAVHFNSSVTFMPGSGVKKARAGLDVMYNSSASCYVPGLTLVGTGGAGDVMGVDFSDCAGRALHVGFNSTAGLSRSNFNNAGGDYAVYVIWNSRVDLYQTQAKNCSGTGIISRDGSTVNARGTDVSGAGNRGYHALHNARINARYSEETPAGLNGASDCGDIGVLASNGGYIEAVDLPATNCGNAGFAAVENSLINAAFGDASGAGDEGVIARGGSIVNFQSGIANNVTGSAAIYAEGASMIDARSATATTATGHSVHAYSGSTISADLGTFSSTGSCIVAERGSTISLVSATASSSGTSVVVVTGSTVAANGSTVGSLSQVGNQSTGRGIIHTNSSSEFTQRGWGYLTGDGDDTTTGAITFPVAFSGLPSSVTITAIGTKAGVPANIGDFTASTAVASASAITASGCNVTIWRNTTMSNTVRAGYSWVATGAL